MHPIAVTERLPEDGQRVLIFVPTSPHGEHRRGWHTAWFQQGKVARGEIGEVIAPADQWGNNKRPYRWVQHPAAWFGQQVSHWLPLPPDPKEIP